MLRAYISPSKLESYRQFMSGTNEWATEQGVIDNIKGVKVWKAAFDLGTAFHLTLEHGPEPYWQPELQRYLVTLTDMDFNRTISFSPEQMQWALRLRRAYPEMVNEIEGEHEADYLGVGPVTLRYRLDGLHGLHVHEHKTTSRPYHVETYADSVQWRIYLLVTGAMLCQYNVFCLLRPDEGGDAVVEAHAAKFYPYQEMREDIADLIAGYLEFVTFHGLEPYVYR